MIRVTVFLLLFMAAAFAEDYTPCATEDWTPPDLTKITAGAPSQLLLVKVAQEELGYIEGKNGYSKYADWYDGSSSEWCTEFVTWCASQADERYGTSILETVYPYSGNSNSAIRFFTRQSRFVSASGRMTTGEKQWLIGSDVYLSKNEYIPYIGDYMFLYTGNREEGADHTALVEGISLDADGAVRVHVIEGNMPDRVQRAAYLLAGSGVYGFGTPERRVYTQLYAFDSTEAVNLLQDSLVALGYLSSEEPYSGVLSGKLIHALEQFQTAQGLKADRVVGIDTVKVLEEELERLGL